MYPSYEDLVYINYTKETPILLEGFLGTDIVLWYGRIERQLVNYVEQAAKGKNYVYRDKLDEFLRLWRDNKIDASLNREPIDKLLAAASILAVDNWSLANYFRALRDQLKRLLASIEDVSQYMIPQQQAPGGLGGGGGGGGGLPFAPSFGPEKTTAGEPGPGLGGGLGGGGPAGAQGAGAPEVAAGPEATPPETSELTPEETPPPGEGEEEETPGTPPTGTRGPRRITV